MRSHSAGSIGHLYELDEGSQQLFVAPPHSSPKPMPPSIIQQGQGHGHYKEGGGGYDDPRSHTTRSTSQRIFFTQPAAPEAPSPRSVGRGYSFASSRSEFHSFETVEVASVPSADSHPSSGYRRHSTMFPMRSSEGFTSGEFSEAEHPSSQLYPQRLPSPPVQLDLPAWHSINRSSEGNK
jgi:hypothetical protein